MPLGVYGSDETLHDSLVTATTARSKLLVVALPAEGLAVLLVEPFRPKVLATQRAEEVLGMPRTIQGPHHTLRGERGEGEREGGREKRGRGEGGEREERERESRRLVMQVSPPIWNSTTGRTPYFSQNFYSIPHQSLFVQTEIVSFGSFIGTISSTMGV